MGLSDYIQERRRQRSVLLMCHMVAGYPSLDANRQMHSAMINCGVDLIELQMPFTEPIADGETFALASQIAVSEGMTTAQYFDLLGGFTDSTGVPILAVGYYNWPFKMGLNRFVEALSKTGASGWILPDLPIEEATELKYLSDNHGIASVFQMTPTDSNERLMNIGTATNGFSYCALRKGVTGEATHIDSWTTEFLERCRRASPVPIAAGFGVDSGDGVDALKSHSDIIIVGSALLRRWQSHGVTGFRDLIEELVDACS